MPQGWGLARFIGPGGGGGFELSFYPGGGEFAHPKNCPGVLAVGGRMVMRLYERLSQNCQESMFVLAYGHLLLDETPFI